jgi:hypothetical protein
LIHEHRFDRAAPSLQCGSESLDVDAVRERVGAELQPIRDIVVRDDQTTETPGIEIVHGACELAACDVEACAFRTPCGLCRVRVDPLAGHAEMREEPRSIVE